MYGPRFIRMRKVEPIEHKNWLRFVHSIQVASRIVVLAPMCFFFFNTQHPDYLSRSLTLMLTCLTYVLQFLCLNNYRLELTIYHLLT